MPPPELEPWLATTFGSVAAVRDQTVVKVEPRDPRGNALRAAARRPPDRWTEHGRDLAGDRAPIEGDPFCHPETDTPADTFGRVRGTRVVTGRERGHGRCPPRRACLRRHDPLAFDTEHGGRRPAHRAGVGRASARRDDPDGGNYLLIWNCLWRAGSSVVHGHAQVLLGSGSHVARLERLRRDVEGYERRGGPDRGDDRGAPRSGSRPRPRRRGAAGPRDAASRSASCCSSERRAATNAIGPSPMPWRGRSSRTGIASAFARSTSPSGGRRWRRRGGVGVAATDRAHRRSGRPLPAIQRHRRDGAVRNSDRRHRPVRPHRRARGPVMAHRLRCRGVRAAP